MGDVFGTSITLHFLQSNKQSGVRCVSCLQEKKNYTAPEQGRHVVTMAVAKEKECADVEPCCAPSVSPVSSLTELMQFMAFSLCVFILKSIVFCLVV